MSIPELVDNLDNVSHADALRWLADSYSGTLHVAAGYVGLEGLDTLAGIGSGRDDTTRLLIGVSPDSLVGAPTPTPVSSFEQSVSALSRQRDFAAFPSSRRAVLERVTRFFESDDVEVRRYDLRFLHGKAYIIGDMGGDLDDDAGLTQTAAPGAALVSSANLTHGGLVSNLELGMVHYQPNVVGMALGWYENLWEDARDFRDDLLDLLYPPSLESDPQTVFLRALLELYDGDLDEPDITESHTLTAFQRDGLARAKHILERYGGVLYADGVGMGKTEIGIQFIREQARELGRHVLIISPAQLRDRLWRQRLSVENLPGTVVSYQELAQDRQLSRDGKGQTLPVDKDIYRFVIIDEAHAYRNMDNTWYSAMDRLMGGTPKNLLLLTATPVNNSLWDLRSLFLLFGRHDRAFAGEPLRIPSLKEFFEDAGASDISNLSEEKLFPLIDALTVRRDRAFIKERYRNERFDDGTPVEFPEAELHERRYDLDSAYPNIAQAIADGIGALTMAQYRRSEYLVDDSKAAGAGATLAGLIQSQMLKRFESSWYSALQTVRRMHNANDAAICFLQQGGLPPSDVIRDIAAKEELNDSFIEDALSESEDSISSEEFRDDFLIDLKKDRDRLAEMTKLLERLEDPAIPDPKLDALRKIMSKTSSQKVAIFTAFQDTARYLEDEIKKDPTLLNGRRWTSVIGSSVDAESRMKELERFCPESVNGAPGFRPLDGEVDALLSTDILSEGQNLQQAQSVLSFDMPWNPQRVVQRNGRVIRLRSPHDRVYLYTLLPEQGDLDRLLRLEARLQSKIQAANISVGMETPVLEDMMPESQIYADLSEFTGRLSKGDTSLLDERGESGSTFAGELFRARLRRASEEGELNRLRALSWGIGAAFAQQSPTLTEPAVFFACRTRSDERYWRMVSQSGKILYRDDLPMLRLIDPQDQPGISIPDGLDLEQLFSVAADDICAHHNESIESNQFASLPPSQLWALGVLRSPDAALGDEYEIVERALSAGRGNAVLRELTALRRIYEGGGMSASKCARKIAKIVERYGLRPVEMLKPSEPITEDDLGVVCFQIVSP